MSNTPTASDQPTPPAPPISAPPPKHRARRWLIRTGLFLVAGALVAGSGMVGAEYYTARPQFCGSCHVMEPYFRSWSHDLHGKKLGVRCIDCHYAPGERATIRAKFRGLSQVASYFSGRYGASRPRAQVNDASCMQSPCHGDNQFQSKMLLIGETRTEKRFVGESEIEVHRTPTVHFYHEKHLKIDDKLSQTMKDRDDAIARLKAALSPAIVDQVQRIAIAILSASERSAAIARLATELNLKESTRADATALGESEHRITRLRQLSGITCSGCHNFNPSGESHLTVDRAACFTCHFSNESFNRGTGECLKCHEAPSRSIMIHGSPSAATVQPVLMDHQDVVRRGVDCASCHFDTIRGDSRVTERACTQCHDQSQYLKEFAARTIETVQNYHAIHIAGQRAHCADCHHVIEHNLVDPERITAGAGFLEPVRNDCAHCHPNHHSEQVQLLTGSGGDVSNRTTPNAMLGSRMNCRGCHTQDGADSKGDQLVRASQQSCLACHGDDYAEMFNQWKSEIDNYLRETEAQYAQIAGRLEKMDIRNVSKRVTELTDSASHNIHLVRAGSGIHNRHYALQLLDTARTNIDQASKLLP